MLVGSILAIYLCENKEDKFLKYSNVGSFLALFILLICFFPQNTFEPPYFPGFLSLIPCLATAGLLYFNRDKNIVSRLFSLPIFVWIGKLSYSLYLWHWLILAVIRYFYGTGELSINLLLIACSLMLLLSIFSFYLIENPIRYNKMSFKKNLVLFYIIPGFIITSWFFYKKSPSDFPIEDLPHELKGFTRCEPEDPTNLKECIVGDRSKTVSVLVAGDSHTGHLNKLIDKIGKKEGWAAELSMARSCPFLLDYTFEFRGQFEGFGEKRNGYLQKNYKKYSTIILSNYWGSKYYKEDPKFIPALEKTLKTFTEEGLKVIVINSMYITKYTQKKHYILEKNGFNFVEPRKEIRGEEFYSYQKTAMNIKSIVDKYPEITWIDLLDYTPSNFVYKGKPMLSDVNHLNDYGAEVIAEEMIKKGVKLIK